MNEIKTALYQYITGLGHVGHIVTDLEQAIADFQKVYGLPDEAVLRLPDPPGVEVMTRFAFVTVSGTDFELIEPVSSAMKKQLLDMPSGLAGINHVAWWVSDIHAAVEVLSTRGVKPGHVTPTGPLDIGNKWICYLDPADTGGLVIELMEKK